MALPLHPQDQRYYASSMSGYPAQQPFTSPWQQPSSAPSSHALYAQSPQVAHHALSSTTHLHSQQPQARLPVTTSLASYGSAVPGASRGSSPQQLSMMDPSPAGRGHGDLHASPQDLMTMNTPMHPHQGTSAPYHGPVYQTSAPSPASATYATSPTNYEAVPYPQQPVARHNYLPSSDPDLSRRYSQSSVSSAASSFDPVDMTALPSSRALSRGHHVDLFRNDSGTEEAARREFQSAVNASQGMMRMKFDTASQETPRAGMYNDTGRSSRGSESSYGFPSAHSNSSSVSSTGYSPGYYGSVDGGSVSDYSTTGSDIEPASSRALPRPQGLMSSQPPAPQSMMNQFSSKVSSSTQKKHKCRVCDKRFTRPSSLQTHMYSHTGEKRKSHPRRCSVFTWSRAYILKTRHVAFHCNVEGCGRNFSVVSNLRRHNKVHTCKESGGARSDSSSEREQEHNQSD